MGRLYRCFQDATVTDLQGHARVRETSLKRKEHTEIDPNATEQGCGGWREGN